MALAAARQVTILGAEIVVLFRSPRSKKSKGRGHDPQSLGIRTTESLLEAAKNPKGRKELAAKIRHRAAEGCCAWPTLPTAADQGMGKEYAGLLREVGVDTVKELRYRNPEKLAQTMANANKKRKLVRFLPSEKLVTRWVEHARKLPQKITY